MRLLRLSLLNPIATIMVFIVVVMLGVVAMSKMPVRLTPNIDRPVISILNYWRASAPAELESEIVEPQEHVLKSVPGVSELRSSVRAGMAITMIEFEIGTDMQMAFINVVNALNQTPPRPREAGEPMVTLGGLESGFASVLVTRESAHGQSDFYDVQRQLRHIIEPELRRIEGVSSVTFNSYQAPQLHITFDPHRLAALHLTPENILQAINRSNDVSGGFAEVGRRQYTVRFEGQYDPDTFNHMIVSYFDGRPVYLSEVASVSLGYEKKSALAYRNNQHAFFLSVNAASDVNTIELMDDIKQAIARLNEHQLQKLGVELHLSFDPSIHIQRAVDLVQSNLGLGIILALILLYVMIRGIRATLLIGLTIPISLAAALLVLALLGRTLNIISLAGLAFAVGLVLDAAIVVLENIVRLRDEGLSIKKAVMRGTREVSPALFASTITTVAIFMPVLFMKGVEGQLFFDLAISMSVAVIASMLGAMFLLPVCISVVFKRKQAPDTNHQIWNKLSALYKRFNGSLKSSFLWVALLLPGAVLFIMLTLPRPDFLPEAKWEGILTVFNVPPGANYQVLESELADVLVERLEPYRSEGKEPQIANYNISMSEGGNVLFVYPEDPRKVKEVLQLLQTEIVTNIPDTQAFSFQSSLLDMQGSSARNILLVFAGEIDETGQLVIENTVERTKDLLPGAIVRPLGFDLNQPEIAIFPKNAALAQAGVDRGTIGFYSRAVTNGAYAGEYFDGNERLDIILRAPQWRTPEALSATPVYTSSGVQTLGQLTELTRRNGPSRIRRTNGQRAVTIAITPPETMSMDEAVEKLSSLISEVRPQLNPNTGLFLSGGADDLADTVQVMGQNFVVALIILLMILTAMFRSVLDGLVVLSAMPFAIGGGVLGLHTLNLYTFQALDLLTMIGFVILLGLVVNNAILLVDQIRRYQALGHVIQDAVGLAIRTRIRPIYMSSLTSVVGMLPLALLPGIGSEIYRGLAMVIVGGMLFSTLFMLFFIPSMLRITDAIALKVNQLFLQEESANA